MNYNHKSGAQKRREKIEIEKRAACGNRTLHVFGFCNNPPTETNSIVDINSTFHQQMKTIS